MKKGILGLLVVLGSALLTSYIDPSDDNSSLLQNALILNNDGSDDALVSINQISIPGFENDDGTNPTPVMVTYSGGASVARTAGCSIWDASDTRITAPNLSATSFSTNAVSANGDSLLGWLDCTGATTGTYTADVNISFTAGSKSYTANTTLTAIKS